MKATIFCDDSSFAANARALLRRVGDRPEVDVGWPYDIHSYLDVAPRLAARGYRVIVPYARGYGSTRFLSAAALRNGRALDDDVSDVFLAILTNGKVTGDGVGPHSDLLAEFPYLGPPHKFDRVDINFAGMKR